MLKLASDADVSGDLVRGLRRREPALDLVRVQEAGLRTAGDPDILAWAAAEGRLLLTQDRRTMIGHAYSRVNSGEPMAGLLVVNRRQGIGAAIEDIVTFAVCSTEDDAKDAVFYLPL